MRQPAPADETPLIGEFGRPYTIDEERMMLRKITPFLWFNDQAEEAMNFYISIFKNSEVVSVDHSGDKTVMMARFRLDGQEFLALNGGPQFQFSEATSFYIDCQSQEEVDYFWDKLTAGGEVRQCGWLQDKYGLSWQVIPSVLGELLGDPDPAKSGRVMQAMLQMTKIEIPRLQQAYEQS